MKQKSLTRKFKLMLVLAFALLAGQNASSQIVAYDLYYDATENGGIGADLTTTASNFTFANNGTAPAYTTNWDSDTPGGYKDYTIPSFSATAYYNIVANVTMRSDNNGPRDFRLEYNIGAGWVAAGTFEVTTIDKNYGIRLPGACHRAPSLSLRWIATSNVSIGGGTVSASAKNYIQTISVSGDAATQSTQIKFVSITPRTIKVSCTPGTGDRRIIKCNTNNIFTNPTDGFTPSGVSSEYTGAGSEQIIYDGSGSDVTVTINTAPYSNTVLWFRVYDYKFNAGDERYLTNTATQNPKKCELERITVNSPVNVRLTRATMGATVSTPLALVVSERGIVWSYNTPVLDTDTRVVYDNANAGGSFSSVVSGLLRGRSNIYYKGYVTNASGTIYSEEASLSNIPIFSGTGNWEEANLWNVQEVPGANGDATYGSVLDSPTINGTCTLTASNSVTNLTINNTKKLSIDAATTLTVAGSLTNSATSGLVVKAGDETTANASLIFSNKTLNQNVPASVEMYSKASTAGGNHWQYFGVPVQSQTVGTTFSGGSERVRRFNEANHDSSGEDKGLWYPYPALTMAGTETLLPIVGYEVVQSAAKTYTFKGNLNAADFNHPLAYTIVPQLADYAGQNIIANPYTAAINISGLGFGSAEATAYLYNTGSREEWTNNNGATTAGVNPGTYIAVPSALAGSLGIPSQIPSMQGFLVKTTTPTSISIPYSSVVPNAAPQRAPALDQKVATMIDVIGSKSSDRMWIFSLPTCTRNFDNGFDGRKILGYNTQLFAMEGSEDYQINAVNDINNTYLGFQSGSETNLKLKFTHQNLEDKYSRVYLTDLVENKTIEITASGTEYAFTAVPSTTPSQRFKITTSTTDIVTPTNNGEQIKIYGSQGNAIVQNLTNAMGDVYIYTMAGQFVRNVPFSANGVTTISNLKAGAYIVKAKTAAKEVNSYLIIR